jgi:hypothetical protein
MIDGAITPRRSPQVAAPVLDSTGGAWFLLYICPSPLRRRQVRFVEIQLHGKKSAYRRVAGQGEDDQ